MPSGRPRKTRYRIKKIPVHPGFFGCYFFRINNVLYYEAACSFMMNNENELIDRAKVGESRAFGLIYDRYIEKLYRFVYAKTGHRETAEDLTSQVFLKAWDKLDQYSNTKASFSAWLYGIARHTIADHYRRQALESNLVDYWDLADPKADQMDNTEAALLMKKLKPTFSNLSADQRDIILMRIWGGLSYKEIAAVLGKSEAACKMDYLRGIKKLKDSLAIVLLLSLISL